MKKLIIFGLFTALFSAPAFSMGETATSCDRSSDINRRVVDKSIDAPVSHEETEDRSNSSAVRR